MAKLKLEIKSLGFKSPVLDYLCIWVHRLAIIHICLEDLDTVGTECIQSRGPLFLLCPKADNKCFYVSCSESVTWFSGSDRTCLIILLSWDNSTRIMGTWKKMRQHVWTFFLLPLPSVLLVHFIIVLCRCVWFGGNGIKLI